MTIVSTLRDRKETWETPQDLFDELDQEFGFTLDVCALPHNAKCDEFITPEDDALSCQWDGICWMNPPYGRGIAAWVQKAWEESQRGTTVVCLVPSSTDTAWWHDYVMRGEVRFVRGRLRFSGATINAPFSNAVVVFRGAA